MSAIQSWQAAEQKVISRTVVIASPDPGLRQRLKQQLGAMRWAVREANGGAEAMAMVDTALPEALVVDSWLPDLEVGEFTGQMGILFPGVDVLRMDGALVRNASARSTRRHELLHAMRESEECESLPAALVEAVVEAELKAERPQVDAKPEALSIPLPELVGDSEPMRELKRMIRLVAPRSATVLIEGPTGTGKEVVAKALHRLSQRASKPFVVLNCAAIPESLLEAELFGHTRGAFTGAVQSRTGRIEAAHGGTLFLDEIGEMPLALQAKMLRFLECGELQRVGDNEPVRVDVRVIAATHQPLEQRSEERTFRLDLYHRLAVFPLEVPALSERMEDLTALVDFFLEQMGRDQPRKSIASEAMAKLREYTWPGNVRELMHVLERASILSESRSQIAAADIRLRRSTQR